MSKKVIILMIAGIILILGIGLTITGFSLGGEFKTIYINKQGIHVEEGDENYMSTNLENFKNIDIQIYSGKIQLIKSDKNAIEYDLGKHENVTTCEVTDETFSFKTEPRFILSILNFKQSYVKLYYKNSEDLENVYLKTSSGSINVDGINAKTLLLKTSSGSNNISNVVSNSIEANCSSGHFELNNIKSNNIALKVNSGSTKLSAITTNNIKVNSISGSTKIYNLISNDTTVSTSSGSIYVQGTLNGKTNLTASSGWIKAHTNLDKNTYGYNLSANSGSTKVDDKTFKGSIGEDKSNFINAKVSSGSINIYFNSEG